MSVANTRPFEPPPVEAIPTRQQLYDIERNHRPGVAVRYRGYQEVEYWCCIAMDCHQVPWPCLPARLVATVHRPPTT